MTEYLQHTTMCLGKRPCEAKILAGVAKQELHALPFDRIYSARKSYALLHSLWNESSVRDKQENAADANAAAYEP